MIDFYKVKNRLDLHLRGKSQAIGHLKREVDVGMLTALFFDLKGERVIQGGAERYIINLAHLIKEEFGWQMVVFQRSEGELWERDFEGIPVVGMPVRRYKNLNFYFHNFVVCRKLALYNQLDLAIPYCAPSGIAISHGIYWDDPNLRNYKREKMIRGSLRGLGNVDMLVSVDTITLNYFRTRSDCREINRKMSYIPNFVDTDFFTPRPDRSHDSVVTVTYPRRLYEARGFDILVQAFEELMKKHARLKPNLVGEIHNEKVRARVDRLTASYPKNVAHTLSSFDGMQQVYQESDIVVVPTMYSEGTSLSLLEAMASRCCVVATNVGGLTDLVIDNYNGVLCEPTANALRDALEGLIADGAKRGALSEKARETAVLAFNSRRWRERWVKVLAPYLQGK